MPRKFIWILVGVLLIPFLVVGAVAVVAEAIGGTEVQATQQTLAVRSVPAAYVTMVETAGATCPQLSSPLLAAQIYQESGFNPKAVSPTGAEGIAQFEPGTWPNWSSPKDGDGLQNPFNPADAIPAMARYDCALAKDVTKLSGNVQDNMLAAYNAGLGAVLSAGGIPDFSQTQNYVKNISALEASFTVQTGTVAASSVAVGAIAFAYERLGTPYLYGGTGTAADNGEFDCSGLTQAAYASVGVTLPRVAAEQWYAGPHIPKDQLQPGDLVFFAYNINDPSTIHHVGIYVGGGAMIDSPHTGSFIRFDSISESDYIGATRPYSVVPQWPIGPSTTATTQPAQ
jgi:cell wall-associated NlpC family hydrolase